MSIFVVWLTLLFKINATIPLDKVKNWIKQLVSLIVDLKVITDDSYIFIDGVDSDVNLTQNEVKSFEDICDTNHKCLQVSHLGSIKCELQVKPNVNIVVVQSR